MPNSKNTPAANPFTKKGRWFFSTFVITLASVGGAVGINFLWLNPVSNLAGTATNSTKSQTVTGDAIQYKYGTIQLELTATNGKIESIKELQASASSGYEQAIPVLRDEALKAQKADFANLSGATFVSDAYKKAFANALSKLT